MVVVVGMFVVVGVCRLRGVALPWLEGWRDCVCRREGFAVDSWPAAAILGASWSLIRLQEGLDSVLCLATVASFHGFAAGGLE